MIGQINMGQAGFISIFLMALSFTAAAGLPRNPLQGDKPPRQRADNPPRQDVRDAEYAAREAAKHSGDDTVDTTDVEKSAKAKTDQKLKTQNAPKITKKSGRTNKAVKPNAK
jgi:hypothetical protein